MLPKHSLFRSIIVGTALLSCLVPVFASAYCASCQVPKRPKIRTTAYIIPTEQGIKPKKGGCFVCKLPQAHERKFSRLIFSDPYGPEKSSVCSDCIKKSPEKFTLVHEEGNYKMYSYNEQKQAPIETKSSTSLMKRIGFGVMALVAAVICYNTVR